MADKKMPDLTPEIKAMIKSCLTQIETYIRTEIVPKAKRHKTGRGPLIRIEGPLDAEFGYILLIYPSGRILLNDDWSTHTLDCMAKSADTIYKGIDRQDYIARSAIGFIEAWPKIKSEMLEWLDNKDPDARLRKLLDDFRV